MTRARAVLAAAFMCTSPIAFAQTAPSYQLIDLGYKGSRSALNWTQSPPNPTTGGCASLGGTGPSYTSIGRYEGSLTVGWSPTAQGTMHAVVCQGPGASTETDLGVLDGGPNSYAVYLSDFIENIVGWSETDFTPVSQESGQVVTQAFLSTGNGMTGLLSAMNDPHYSSEAYAVNDAGEVVGWGDMLFTSGPFAGEVGHRAMLWEPGGTVYNLQFYVSNNPGITLTDALMVDCHGNIAAEGFPTNNYQPNNIHYYLLVRLNPTSQCPPSGPGPY